MIGERDMTFEDLKVLSIEEPAEETYSHEAMDKLGPAFENLKDPNKVKDGKVFLEELEKIFRGIENGRINGGQISVHTIIGICQLAHWHHDREGTGPSKRKSFEKIIPWLLDRRNKIIKKPPKSIVRYMNQKFDERHKELFGY